LHPDLDGIERLTYDLKKKKRGVNCTFIAMTLNTHSFTSSCKSPSDDVCRKADRFFVTVSRHCSVKMVAADKIHMFSWSETELLGAYNQ
jgi:hypothetical protein